MNNIDRINAIIEQNENAWDDERAEKLADYIIDRCQYLESRRKQVATARLIGQCIGEATDDLRYSLDTYHDMVVEMILDGTFVVTQRPDYHYDEDEFVPEDERIYTEYGVDITSMRHTYIRLAK